MCILVTSLNDVRSGLGDNLADNKSFQEDFKLNGSAWFYNVNSGRRSVAILVKDKANC